MRAGGTRIGPTTRLWPTRFVSRRNEGRIHPSAEYEWRYESAPHAHDPSPLESTRRVAPSSRLVSSRPDAKFSQTPHRIQFGNHRGPDRQRQGNAQRTENSQKHPEKQPSPGKGRQSLGKRRRPGRGHPRRLDPVPIHPRSGSLAHVRTNPLNDQPNHRSLHGKRTQTTRPRQQ